MADEGVGAYESGSGMAGEGVGVYANGSDIVGECVGANANGSDMADEGVGGVSEWGREHWGSIDEPVSGITAGWKRYGGRVCRGECERDRSDMAGESVGVYASGGRYCGV